MHLIYMWNIHIPQYFEKILINNKELILNNVIIVFDFT